MRIIDIIRWSKKEYQSKLSPKEIYDELASNSKYETSINYSNRVKELSKVFSTFREKYSNILDLACGTGALIDALPWKSTAKIVGIDISPEMLKVAKKRFSGFPNITFQEGSFMELNFPKQSFDLITNAYATRFIPVGKEEEFVGGIQKILKSDGRFIVFSDGAMRSSSLFLNKLGFGPKSYNLKLNYYQDIIKEFSSTFSVEKVIFIRRIPLIYRNTAIVFKKQSD